MMPITTIEKLASNRTVEKKYYTPEEYLALEEKAEYKHEYRNGQIVAMTGATTNHNEIAGNLYAHLKFALRGEDYRVFIGDVRLWIPEYKQYTYNALSNHIQYNTQKMQKNN